MFKKLFTISLSIIILAGIFYAREITYNEAQIIAENWTEILEEDFGDQVRVMDGREIFRENILVAYVFDFYPKGYVIISRQDYLPPIKMYSLKYNYKTSGEPLEHLVFETYKNIIKKVESENNLPESEEYKKNRNLIRNLLNSEYKYRILSKSDVFEEIQQVEPLLSTVWSQGGPYNNYCPEIDGIKTVTGCVATSFAQILNYYEYPARGRGSYTYTTSTHKISLSANFDKEYEWWNMRDKNNTADEEAHAVATLMYDVGVALHSDYTSKWGTAGGFSHNFAYHFKYSNDSRKTHNFYKRGEEWFNVAKNQVDNGWPVEYSIFGDTLGHSVVIDGYRISNGVKMVHINFGWGGAYNGYYVMNNLHLSDEYNFNSDSQFLLLNFYPYPEYERPVGLPPENVSASAYLNQSVFLKEYIVQIKWPESPSKDKRIDKYIIYQKEGGTVTEIARIDPEDGRTYEIRTKELSGISYSVGVIDKNGAISDMPSFVTPVLR